MEASVNLRDLDQVKDPRLNFSTLIFAYDSARNSSVTILIYLWVSLFLLTPDDYPEFSTIIHMAGLRGGPLKISTNSDANNSVLKIVYVSNSSRRPSEHLVSHCTKKK